MSKVLRQRRILGIVAESPVGSQDELRRQLGKTGVRVAQATLSRDINELGLVKTQEGYTPPAEEDAAARSLPSLERLLREFVVDLRPTDRLLVVKTAPGSAQPVAAALDSESWPEVLGTIGGDDTILIITSSRKSCQRVTDRIRQVVAP